MISTESHSFFTIKEIHNEKGNHLHHILSTAGVRGSCCRTRLGAEDLLDGGYDP
jgi:hypothetical protein